MKTKLFFLGLAFIAGLSCNNTTNSDKESAQSTTKTRDPDSQLSDGKKTCLLLLLDKTASTTNLAVSLDTLRVDKIIYAYHNVPGSVMWGHFIHANTLGVPPFVKSLLDITPLPKERDKLPKMTSIKLLKTYNYQLRQKNTMLRSTIFKNRDMAISEQVSHQTDLWATFELMSRFFKNADADAEKVVVYFSDMVESVKAKGRRDFGRKPIKSKAEAENFAKQDAAWILKNLDVDTSVLKNVSVQVYPPSGSLDKNNLQYLRYYWEALFKEMSIQKVALF